MKIIRLFFRGVAAVTLAILAFHNFGATASAQATRVVTITDPILNMQAYSLSIPANWIFDGAVIPGTSCNDGPFPVFRMMSPNGLTGVKQLPRLDWTWADKNGKPLKSREECLPYKRGVPAADLKQTRRNAAAQSSNMLALSADKARAVVRYHINKIVIEEKLNVFVSCRYFRNIGQHGWSANVSRLWAPEKSFSDATFQPIVKSFTADKQWTDTRTRIVIQKINDMSDASMRAIRQMGDEVMRRSKAQFNAFNQAQEMRQRQHQQFFGVDAARDGYVDGAGHGEREYKASGGGRLVRLLARPAEAARSEDG